MNDQKQIKLADFFVETAYFSFIVRQVRLIQNLCFASNSAKFYLFRKKENHD